MSLKPVDFEETQGRIDYVEGVLQEFSNKNGDNIGLIEIYALLTLIATELRAIRGILDVRLIDYE